MQMLFSLSDGSFLYAVHSLSSIFETLKQVEFIKHKTAELLQVISALLVLYLCYFSSSVFWFTLCFLPLPLCAISNDVEAHRTAQNDDRKMENITKHFALCCALLRKLSKQMYALFRIISYLRKLKSLLRIMENNFLQQTCAPRYALKMKGNYPMAVFDI